MLLKLPALHFLHIKTLSILGLLLSGSLKWGSCFQFVIVLRLIQIKNHQYYLFKYISATMPSFLKTYDVVMSSSYTSRKPILACWQIIRMNSYALKFSETNVARKGSGLAIVVIKLSSAPLFVQGVKIGEKENKYFCKNVC